MDQIAERKEEMGRATNFTEEEEVALTTAVKQREHILFSKFDSGAVSSSSKKKAWQEIATAVNAICGMNRTIESIKVKHKNMKTNTKKKASQNARAVYKTGGGTSQIIPLSHAEEILLQTIPEETIHGIVGGIDLHENDVEIGTEVSISDDPMATFSVVLCNPESFIEVPEAGSSSSASVPAEGSQPSFTQPNRNAAPTDPDPARTPSNTSGRRLYRKAESTNVEKLMKEQITASAALVTATERICEELKTGNDLKRKTMDMLERFVVVKEEELKYKRLKYENSVD